MTSRSISDGTGVDSPARAAGIGNSLIESKGCMAMVSSNNCIFRCCGSCSKFFRAFRSSLHQMTEKRLNKGAQSGIYLVRDNKLPLPSDLAAKKGTRLSHSHAI